MPTPLVVIAETADHALTTATLECVEEARDVADALATRVHVVLPGDGVQPLAATLAAHGADRVTVIEHPALAQFSADGWLAAVAPVLQAARPAFTLAPDSGYGRSWLPRLSARWRIPLPPTASG
jgi:electron transfer flavoprotein alpha subunit